MTFFCCHDKANGVRTLIAIPLAKAKSVDRRAQKRRLWLEH